MNMSSVVVETRFLKLVDLNSTPHATAEVVTAALVDYLQGKGLRSLRYVGLLEGLVMVQLSCWVHTVV